MRKLARARASGLAGKRRVEIGGRLEKKLPKAVAMIL
jgi:hypothetical protein